MSEVAEMTFSSDIKEMGDKIAALTIVKAVELKEYLKVTYKIEPAAGGVVMQGGGGGAGPAAVKEVQTEFTVMLMGFDAAKKINVIKEVRALTGLGLKEAKDLVEGSPKPIKENIPKDEAEKIKKQLEEGGAKIEIK